MHPFDSHHQIDTSDISSILNVRVFRTVSAAAATAAAVTLAASCRPKMAIFIISHFQSLSGHSVRRPSMSSSSAVLPGVLGHSVDDVLFRRVRSSGSLRRSDVVFLLSVSRSADWRPGTRFRLYFRASAALVALIAVIPLLQLCF